MAAHSVAVEPSLARMLNSVTTAGYILFKKN